MSSTHHPSNHHILAVMARNTGAYLLTHTKAFLVRHKGARTYIEIQLCRADGSLIQSAVGPTKTIALNNLDTRLSLR